MASRWFLQQSRANRPTDDDDGDYRGTHWDISPKNVLSEIFEILKHKTILKEPLTLYES